MNLRPATADDLPALVAIVRAAYEPYIERIGREPAPMSADYAAIIHAGDAWVAERDGESVGLIVLRSADEHLLVENIAVAPTAQGLGVGARLLAFADTEAARRGLPELRLYTNQLMTENLTYYPRRGYRETHRGQSEGFDRVYFSKPANPGL